MPPTSSPERGSDAGLTLVEVLVVLALMGIAAGAVGLGLGPAARGTTARAEADLLAARMRRASEEVVLTGEPVALRWSEDGYRFLSLRDGAWAPHPVPLLAETKALGGGLAFAGEPQGSFVVAGDALPVDGAALVLRLSVDGNDPERAVSVTWDGATAIVSEEAR